MTSILFCFSPPMLLLFSERSPWMCQISRRYCLLADARLQVPITRHPCGVISIKLWQKRSNLYHEKMTLFWQTLAKVFWARWHGVRQTSPITHVTSYIWVFTRKHSASSLHNNRWLSVGSATDGILLKTDFAFELPHTPDIEKVSYLASSSSPSSFPSSSTSSSSSSSFFSSNRSWSLFPLRAITPLEDVDLNFLVPDFYYTSVRRGETKKKNAALWQDLAM